MKEKFFTSLTAICKSAGQSPALFFPAASETFNARYQVWYEKQEPKLPAMPIYRPHIDVIAQNSSDENALALQQYPNAALLDAGKKGAGDYVMYLFKGDTLAPGALLTLAASLSGEGSRPDLVYADEDICKGGRHSDPHFKTLYTQIDLLSRNCIGRPMLVGRSLHEAAGSLQAWDEAAYYDYVLRVAAQSRYARHIAWVLLSRERIGRIKEGEGRAAIDAYLHAQGQNGYAVSGSCPNTFRVRMPSKKMRKWRLSYPTSMILQRFGRCLKALRRTRFIRIIKS